VRPEYRALVDGLPALMSDFDCGLDAAARTGVEVFMRAVDRVDRELDAIADGRQRHAFSDRVVAVLCASDAADATPELADLRAILCERDLLAPFARGTRLLLVASEEVRTCRDASAYLDRVEHEGRLLVELALLFVAPQANQRFITFFRALAEIANLLDKLLDARGDHRRGELAMPADLTLHALLASRLLRRLPGAVRLHPRRLHFIAWGLDLALRSHQRAA